MRTAKESMARLDQLNKEGDDSISQLPDIQPFLQARGLTSIAQLDRQGRRELEGYLRSTLRNTKN
jgi:hypothetical protein